MTGARTFICRHAAIALLIVGLALGARSLIPAGYMTTASQEGLTVELCSGIAGQTVTIALPGHPQTPGHDKAKADAPCTFAGLGQMAMPGTDPVLLVLAIAFIMAVSAARFAPSLFPGWSQIRPPLRGPPLVA